MRKPGDDAAMPGAMNAGDERLEDEQIERGLHAGFAPHRCAVRFERDAFAAGRRVALLIEVRSGSKREMKEFHVEGIPVDLLRDPKGLSEYIDDIRRQLQQRRVSFPSTGINSGRS